MITCKRYHDISCGHRVHGHESKCAHLHGHNYRVHFTCRAKAGLDVVGRVIDFSVMKARLCLWLEDNWDHKFLAWEKDPVMRGIQSGLDEQFSAEGGSEDEIKARQSIVWVPFNPTAENMALYLANVLGPRALEGTDAELIIVEIEETMKCSARVVAECFKEDQEAA